MDSEKDEVRKDRRGAEPGKFGQRAFVPTDQQRADVRAWIKITDGDTIARQLGISRDTLDKYFKQELAAGRFEAVAAVGGKLVQKAMNGNLGAMIFYLRTQGKWSTRVEVTGKDGGPLRHIDLAGFLADKSEEELALLEPLLEQLLAASGGDGLPDDDSLGVAAGEGEAG